MLIVTFLIGIVARTTSPLSSAHSDDCDHSFRLIATTRSD